MELRTMPIADLKPAPYNPRTQLKPGDPAWNKLKRSLQEFGLVEPLVWNELTGHIVGGHARLAILRELNATTVPVSVVRLSVQREKALNVVLNNREAQGRFDSKRLVELLAELEKSPEFELTGFTANDMQAMNLKPADMTPEVEKSDDVEISLTVPREQFAALAAKLDLLIQDFDVACLVRGA